MQSWTRHKITELVARYGTVPPPWVVYDEHPYSICWRMGGGEGHKLLWWEWWDAEPLSIEERIAYFRRWPPPHCWLLFLIEAIWGVDTRPGDGGDGSDEHLAPFFAYTEALGFGNHDEYQLDLNDPEWLED